jgi:membrane protein
MADDGGSAAVNEGLFGRARRFVLEDLWRVDLRPRSITAAAIRLLQLGVMIAQGFVRDHLLLRATALTYVTILSLIPLLIVMVAVVGLVGDQEKLIKFVVGQVTAVSPEVSDAIADRVRGVKLGSLGTLGGSVLLATTVLALRHLETTLNEIWGVRAHRTWARRFADYLTILVVAPILTVTAISLATTIQAEPLFERMLKYPLFGTLHDAGLEYLPNILIWISFSFTYWFFPNTKVRSTSAVIGGLVAMILFSVARFLYVDLSVGSARYSVLFGGMVAVPLILVWVYTCWAVILLGAEVAFAHQNLSHYRRELRSTAPAAAEREAVGLAIAVEVARAFQQGELPRTADGLAVDLDIPVRSVRQLLEAFDEAQLMVVSGREGREGGYLPARPLAGILVSDVLRAMRGRRRPPEDRLLSGSGAARTHEAVDRVIHELELAVVPLAERRSLADVLEGTAEA